MQVLKAIFIIVCAVVIVKVVGREDKGGDK